MNIVSRLPIYRAQSFYSMAAPPNMHAHHGCRHDHYHVIHKKSHVLYPKSESRNRPSCSDLFFYCCLFVTWRFPLRTATSYAKDIHIYQSEQRCAMTKSAFGDSRNWLFWKKPGQLQKLSSLGIKHAEATTIILSKKWTRMMLIRLRGCHKTRVFFS